MPQNKKHHYVPQFLMRRFSADKRSINLYNIASRRTITGASLKQQCYSNYLYGKDGTIEKSLALAEGEVATLLQTIDQNGIPPPPFTPSHDALLFFVISQHSRTKYAAEALDESFDKITKAIFREKMKADGHDIDRVSIGLTDPAIQAFGISITGYPLLWDMRYKLLINETNEEFIISDNPVVYYNQLLSFRTFGSNCGTAFKGLQIFVPLDPRKTLVMYDATSYRVGGTTLRVRITNPRDIYELNTLQFVAASENLYYRDPHFNAVALHKKAAPFLRATKSKVTKSAKKAEPHGGFSFIVTMSTVDVRTNLQLSPITTLGSARKFLEKLRGERLQPAIVVRNEFLVKSHKEFQDACAKGEYGPQQFKEFFEKKLGRKVGRDDPPSSRSGEA